MSERKADVILQSVLLPPREDSELLTYLNRHDSARNVPVISGATRDSRGQGAVNNEEMVVVAGSQTSTSLLVTL